MELTVYNMEKKEIGRVPMPEGLAGVKVNSARIYQTVVQQQVNRRQGNARVKNRHEVSGSTRKIYRQKGTGRARHGDIKAPLFVGGGQAFGPKPREWRSNLPAKIRQGAIRDLLGLKGKEGKLWIVDRLELPEPKTRRMADFFKAFGLSSGLLLLEAAMPTVEKSVRNLARFKAITVGALNAVDLMKYDHLLMTRAAYDRCVERYR